MLLSYSPRLLPCVLILLIPLLINSDRVGYASRVLELSDRFLEIRKDGIWLVKFYAPWCGHCKKLEPIYNHVAQALHDTPIRVGKTQGCYKDIHCKVDCTRFPTVGTEFQVNGFPTIMFLKGTRKHIYTGERGTEEIVSYAKRMAGPPVKEFTPELLNLNKIFFGFIGTATNCDLWSSFVSVAEDHQSNLDFYIINKNQEEFKHLLKNDESKIIVYKDEEIYEFENDVKETNLTAVLGEWVLKERFNKFTKVSRSNFQQLLSTRKYIVMAIVEEDKLGRIVTKEMNEFKNMIQHFANINSQIYRTNFQFGWVGSPELANSVAMSTLPIPSLLVVNSTSYHHHIPNKHLNNHDDLKLFLQQLINQTAEVYGGNSWTVRLYRTYYESKISLINMWSGNPVLTALLFGLPMGFMSLICYSICCADILDNNYDNDYEQDEVHEKKE